ncbi:very short patch repair endonuclease [Candidatus Endoriftia persephonae]|jgi:DNA mismatch endonuclease (patch repair protein)|uniref:Very short patch repair endonuclease n=2 Tax=Gammaproteobacteria TaxID=1236 RepID=G2FJW6_9GAMM|nr:very short patch repair endonuclease [Candidatus Endoriftia persephone]EGW52907.1 very-short-patch mismatch repair endonuclease [endosymbiont of Tevnia jerichonana (vent Tica)]USF86384.1 very short patch repair endonuclease [Candidatus Endoriftia persephone]
MQETAEQRSRIMRCVKSKDTKPELVVRKISHSLGYRHRLYRKDLPGKPDLVYPSRKKIIFVHGCFWHGHKCKRGDRLPKSNREYWVKKIKSNMERDKLHIEELNNQGWSVLIVWECEVKNLQVLTQKIAEFIDG